MTNNIERAAEVIWDEQALGLAKPRDLADALAEAGLLAPVLPAPLGAEEADRTGAPTAARWKTYTTDGRGEYAETVYVDAYENEIWLVNSHDDLLDPESARALAYALLAAANHAQKEENNDYHQILT